MSPEWTATVYDAPDKSNTEVACSIPRDTSEEETAWQRLLALKKTGGNGRAQDTSVPPGAGAAAQKLYELYLPLCPPPDGKLTVIGHLGQSLDGKIATGTGHSRFINGQANILHLHRLRALVDGILVGAGTVAADDPQLTVRLCQGPCPTRIVIDTNRRLHDGHRMFNDGAAPTLVVCADDALKGETRVGQAELLGVKRVGEWIDVHALLRALTVRGVRSLLVEGGGVTVSRFLAARALTRLQITVAPVIIGSGRPGLTLPAIAHMDEALRPPIRRFEFGDDVLFDCDVESA